MKYTSTFGALVVFFVSIINGFSAVTLTGFGTGEFSKTFSDFTTTQTATTFNISGTDFGLSLYGTISPSPINIFGNTVSLSLTGTFTGTATSPFQIDLFDNAGNDVLYQANFSAFTQGVESTVTLLPVVGGTGVFNNNVVSIGLLTSGTGSSVNLTLNNLAAGPVPEPSTWASLAFGIGVLSLVMRRKRNRVE